MPFVLLNGHSLTRNWMLEMKSIKTGVGVIVCRNQKVLIGQRCGSHGEGIYSFPGGHIELEDFEKGNSHKIGSAGICAEREVLEETGMIVDAFSVDSHRAELFTTFDILSKDCYYVTPYILANYVSGGTFIDDNTMVPLEPNKCKFWKWVDIDELLNLVKTENEKAWIPVEKVVFYLKQIWGF